MTTSKSRLLATAQALVLAGLLQPAAAAADVLMEYVGPPFTKLVIATDGLGGGPPRIDQTATPVPVRARVRLIDAAVAGDTDFGNNNYLPEGHEPVKSVQITDGRTLMDYANRQQLVEFRVKPYRGQLVEWQLRGSAQASQFEIVILGPGRTTTGEGSRIPGAAQCPTLDIVITPGRRAWYCGLGTWTIKHIADDAVLAPLLPPR